MARVTNVNRATPSIESVTLELTGEEAQTLRIIGMRVGGSPNRSRRKDMDSINQALTSAGVEAGIHYERCFDDDEDGRRGSIYFKEGVR